MRDLSEGTTPSLSGEEGYGGRSATLRQSVAVPVRAILFGITYVVMAMGVIPWLFARWLGSRPATLGSAVPGILLIGGGLLLFLWCVVLFVRNGRGTQSPMDPPRRFVAEGPYGTVRNPMLLGNLIVLIGEAVLFTSIGIAIFTLLFSLGCHVILLTVEEPSLRRRFGEEYAAYCRRVPRWLPRWRRLR